MPNNFQTFKKALLVFLTIGVLIIFTSFAALLSSYSKATKNEKIQYPTKHQALDLTMIQNFNKFIVQHSKYYLTEEQYQRRLAIYQENLAYIEEINTISALEDLTLPAQFQANKFSDLDRQEIKRYNQGLIFPEGFDDDDPILNDKKHPIDADHSDDAEYLLSNPLYQNLPQSKEWEATSVKNQGQCGSCVIFAINGAIESLYKNITGRDIDLSEQQVVDCSKENFGCRGGFPVATYQYLKRYGSQSQQSYPYVGRHQPCMYNPQKIVLKISDYRNVTRFNEIEMKVALLQAPLTVAVDAQEMFYYHRGIMRGRRCYSLPNHLVELVGYGQWQGIKFWKVKNSWGNDWGYNGFGYFLREDHSRTLGACSIAYLPTYPILEEVDIEEIQTNLSYG